MVRIGYLDEGFSNMLLSKEEMLLLQIILTLYFWMLVRVYPEPVEGWA